jgi:hypothetical protein
VPPHCRGFTITLRHTTLGWNPLDQRSASRRDLFQTVTTHNSQNTDIHDPAGIGTRNPSKRTAADPRLRPRGHRDRPKFIDTHVEIYCSDKCHIPSLLLSLSLYATVLFSYRVVPATLFCSKLTIKLVKHKIPVLFTVARLCFTFRVN